MSEKYGLYSFLGDDDLYRIMMENSENTATGSNGGVSQGMNPNRYERRLTIPSIPSTPLSQGLRRAPDDMPVVVHSCCYPLPSHTLRVRDEWWMLNATL